MTEQTPPSLPENLQSLPVEIKESIEAYAKAHVDFAFISVDRMLDATTHIITFLPGWIISKLTPKYVDPMLAARTTPKLSLKQAIKVSNALPIAYLGQTAAYLDLALAAEILLGLNDRHGVDMMSWLCANNPTLAIALAEHTHSDRRSKKIMKAFDIPQTQQTQLPSDYQDKLQTLLAAL